VPLAFMNEPEGKEARTALHRRRDRLKLLSSLRPALGAAGSFIDAGLGTFLRHLGSCEFVSYLTGPTGPLAGCEFVCATDDGALLSGLWMVHVLPDPTMAHFTAVVLASIRYMRKCNVCECCCRVLCLAACCVVSRRVMVSCRVVSCGVV